MSTQLYCSNCTHKFQLQHVTRECMVEYSSAYKMCVCFTTLGNYHTICFISFGTILLANNILQAAYINYYDDKPMTKLDFDYQFEFSGVSNTY